MLNRISRLIAALALILMTGRVRAEESFVLGEREDWSGRAVVGNADGSLERSVVAIPEGTVDTDLHLRPTQAGQDVRVHFANSESRTLRITVFDEKVVDQGREVLLLGAGIEIQPLNVRYTLRPAALLTSPTERIRRWNQEPDVYQRRFVLSLRQSKGAVEFRLNGSYVGTMHRDTRADSLTVGGKVDKVAFSRTSLTDRFMPIDIRAKCRSGSTQIELTDHKIPFTLGPGDGLDLGVTAKQASLGGAQASLAETPASFVFTVPCEQYTHAWVLCAIDDPARDPVLNARLTRYVAGHAYQGRAFEAMANTRADLPGTATRVGTVQVAGRSLPLWRAEVRLATGKIQDLVFSENRGTHARMRFGKYLDFELSGRLVERRSPSKDRRSFPDPKFPSAVRVFGVTLERPAAEMEVRTLQPGNIFHNAERPEIAVQIRPRRAGSYRLGWTIRGAEERVVGSGEKPVGAHGDQEVTLPLAQRELGWYGIDFSLFDGPRLLLVHQASFALLGPDTRKAEVADSPYGSWNYGGAHYTPPDVETYGPVLFKAGFRRSAGVERYSEQELTRWKLATPVIRTGGLEKTDAEMRDTIRRNVARYPSVDNLMIFHENAEWVYQSAPELIGQQPAPGAAWKDADKRWDHAVRLARIVRQEFPQLRITLGNSLASTELIAEGLRRKFPEAYADYLGLEVVGRTSLPERQWEGSLQAADLMLQTARAFGYQRWKINACYESNYRLDALLGPDRQAQWYVRDLLLSQAWQFRDIFIGVIMDTGNEYAGSFWGASGLCTRYPFMYPKRAYVAVATATRLLDQVTLRRNIPTGSKTVYALEFSRRDGRWVYPLWTSRGTAELTLETATADYEIFDMYGRRVQPASSGHSLRLTAGTAPQYILSAGPLVQRIACGTRTYPEDRAPTGLRVVDAMDDAGRWTLIDRPDPLLEKTQGVVLPYRAQGRYAMRQVTDPEQGRCLELELVEPNLRLPSVFYEYAVLKLKKPIALSDRPNSLGVWVKGNSGWGQVYWVLEDGAGNRRISCGTRIHRADVFDYDGRVSIAFDGWNFLSVPVTDRSSITDLSTGSADNLWEYGQVAADGTFRRGPGVFRDPVKLVGVAFAAQSRPLFLTQRQPHRQVVRFKDLAVFDP
jgi:hypothetical protein